MKVSPAEPPMSMNSSDGEAERGEVGQADRGEQVERRDQAAHDQGEQEADDQDRHWDYPGEVAVGDGLTS